MEFFTEFYWHRYHLSLIHIFSKKFTATILWMDDEELTVGKDYLVKIGTRTIPGILKNIQYKIDVNTGEFIPVGRLRKNEIAVCDLDVYKRQVIPPAVTG